MKPHEENWDELLLDYAAGTEDVEVKEAVEQHLAEGCEACENEVVRIVSVGIIAGAQAARLRRRRVLSAALVASAAALAVVLLRPMLTRQEPPVSLHYVTGGVVARDLEGQELWRWEDSGRRGGLSPVLLAIGSEMAAFIPLKSEGEWRLTKLRDGREEPSFSSSLRASLRARDLGRMDVIRWRDRNASPNLLLVVDEVAASHLLRVDAVTGEVLAHYAHKGRLATFAHGNRDSVLIEIDERDRLTIVIGGQDERGYACVLILGRSLQPIGKTLVLPKSGLQQPSLVNAVQPYRVAGRAYIEVGTGDYLRLRIGYSDTGWGSRWRIDFTDQSERAFEAVGVEQMRKQLEKEVSFR